MKKRKTLKGILDTVFKRKQTFTSTQLKHRVSCVKVAFEELGIKQYMGHYKQYVGFNIDEKRVKAVWDLHASDEQITNNFENLLNSIIQ